MCLSRTNNIQYNIEFTNISFLPFKCCSLYRLSTLAASLIRWLCVLARNCSNGWKKAIPSVRSFTRPGFSTYDANGSGDWTAKHVSLGGQIFGEVLSTTLRSL